MLNRVFTIILLSVCSLAVCAQDKNEFDGHNWEAPYLLPTPKDWGIERFLIPISFAPQIPYKGVEDIRFTPGWAKATGEEYWSYAFLWYLDGEIKLTPEIIAAHLKAYYTGLVNVNGGGIPKEKIIPVETAFTEIRGTGGSGTGTVRMTDYMSHNPITLNFKLYVHRCPRQDKTYVFFELSPQPFTHNVWQGLDKLWSGFRCTKD